MWKREYLLYVASPLPYTWTETRLTPEGTTIHRQLLTWLAAIILILLAAARFINLDGDPPLFYSHLSQSLLTDPYHLTFYARSAVLFDNWTPFDFHRFDVFRNSMISGLAWLYFAAFGVSTMTANLAALTASLLGILLFLLGMKNTRPPREIFFSALLLLTSSHLFFYGRVPFLENGLILLSGLVYFVMMRYHDRPWGQLTAGILIALAAFAGKLFGLLLLGPVILSILYLHQRRATIPIVITLGGFVIGACAYLLIFYGNDISLLRSYYLEQSVDLYGGPPALNSVNEFAFYYVTFGNTAGVWRFTPFFAVLACVGFLMAASGIDLRKPNREDLPIIFSALWILCGFLSLMLFAYRPLRYMLFLFLPASALIGYAIERAIRDDWSFKATLKWLSMVLVIGCLWYLLTEIALLFIKDWKTAAAAGPLKWLTLVAAIASAAGLHWFLTRYRSSWRRIIILAPIAALTLGTVLKQSDLVLDGLTHSGDALKRYSRELGQLIHPDAVLTGPFMPALTIENDLQGVIYNFNLANTDPDFVDRYGITHVLTDGPAWRTATKKFTVLQSAQLLAQVAMRDRVVEIYRLPTAPGQLTEFEMGALALTRNKWEIALPYLRRIVDQQPESLLGKLHLAMALYAGERYEECVALLEEVDSQFPDDYMAHEYAREFYSRIFRRTQIPEYQHRAEYHAAMVKQLNAYAPSAVSE